MNNSLKFYLTTLGLIFITILTYHNALRNDFIDWDVNKYIIENEHIKSFNWDNIYWMWTSFYIGNWHPLTWFSHALDYHFFGLQPWGHHLTSVVIHAFNSVLFFILSILLLRQIQYEKKFSDQHIFWTSAFAALLFTIHPQRVESVVWAAERKDVLCLFFTLLTLIFYLRYVLSNQIRYYLGALLCFVLALLSKGMAVTIPVVFILIDLYPLQRFVSSISYLRLILEKIPFLIISLLSAFITLMAQQSGQAIATLETINITTRLLNAFNSLIFYLSKCIFPIGLSPFYPLPSSFEYPSNLMSILACFLITLISIVLWYRKQRYLLISWLFYLITLMPVLGIIQIGSQAAADRYTYFPMLPFYLLLAVTFTMVFLRYRISTLLGIGILVVLWMHLTSQQILVWKNKLIFWNYVVLHAPNNSLARAHLCRAYFKAAYFEQALEQCHIAVSLGYQEGMPLNLLLLYIELRQIPKALDMYNFLATHHLEIGDDAEFVYYHIGQFYFEQGMFSKAKELLEKVINLNPVHIQALFLLSLLSWDDAITQTK